MRQLDELVRGDRLRQSTAVIAISATVLVTALVMALFHPQTPAEVGPVPTATVSK